MGPGETPAVAGDRTEIVPGSDRHGAATAPLIYDSAHEMSDFLFGDRAAAELAFKILQSRRSGQFGCAFTTLLQSADRVVGLELGYDRRQLAAQTLPGAINLLRATPPKRWWHLLVTVGPVVSRYVMPPSIDAYYINNLAISPDCRGRGLGERLLSHVLERSRRAGYRCVELDVTETNMPAIRLYERRGFHVVSHSGSEESTKRYGLPRLYRMRCVLDDRRPVTLENDGQPTSARVIDDVSGLNRIEVDEVYVPGETARLQAVLRLSDKPVSIGGGRFSMGGQTSEPGTLHIDMRGMNRILAFDPEAATIRVQAGVRWKEIQALAGDHGLAIKIMQTYANFTVGGSLSVNCHGRYIGLGPIIFSVRSIVVLLQDGSLLHASRDDNPDIFFGSIGCYGALGIIVEAELDLVPNTRVERRQQKMALEDYPEYFQRRVRDNPDAVFHNADLIPPRFVRARAVTWQTTDKPPTTRERERAWRFYLPEKYMLWAMTETPGGAWRREYIYEPLLYLRPKVSLRNQEAGYDVAELEPLTRDQQTYVLQEYFVPVSELTAFVARMAEILCRFRVTVVNVSVRNAHADPGSLLAWARQEVFALVLYYKQGTERSDQEAVAVWTRELIDAVLSFGGSFYLPYQAHARLDQFHAAYPRARELFTLKEQLDPNYRFRNVLWERYMRHDDVPVVIEQPENHAEFLAVYRDSRMRDEFYRFLQNVFRVFPEAKFHALIAESCEQYATDEAIYEAIASRLDQIKPALSELTYALPALAAQKREMCRQAETILEHRHGFDGYLEIGSTGRYVKHLVRALDIRGPIYLSNDTAPDNSPAEIAERGSFRSQGEFFPLDGYAPIPAQRIGDRTLDLVTCFIGLHHCPRDMLTSYLASVRRVLRPGGCFLLRDHDADDESLRTFVSLVHTVFNLGTGVSWQDNERELRLFEGLDFWINAVEAQGFRCTGERLLQAHDPSRNTLVCFEVKDQ